MRSPLAGGELHKRIPRPVGRVSRPGIPQRAPGHRRRAPPTRPMWESERDSSILQVLHLARKHSLRTCGVEPLDSVERLTSEVLFPTLMELSLSISGIAPYHNCFPCIHWFEPDPKPPHPFLVYERLSPASATGEMRSHCFYKLSLGTYSKVTHVFESVIPYRYSEGKPFVKTHIIHLLKGKSNVHPLHHVF